LGGNFGPFPTPSSPDKAISAIPVKNPLNKGKQHSTRDLQTLGFRLFAVYIYPSRSLMKRLYMKSGQVVKASLIVFLASLVPQQQGRVLRVG